MAAPSLTLRIAVLQFAPKIGQVQANISRAKELCSKLTPRSIDLLCLPEMIFTGYVFPNSLAISPYLEQPRTGATSQFCAEMAKRLHCYVTAGYPERLQPGETKVEEGITDAKVGANSAVLYGPDGEWVGGYRKTNLFETDQTWAKAGTGFATFMLPSPLRTLSLGICMDLNAQPPANWTIENGPYELADYCVYQEADILVLLNAWLDSKEEPEDEQDWRTLNFWAARLRPLWAKKNIEESVGRSLDAQTKLSDDEGKETIVIICNRSGEENGKLFAGSSAIFSMKENSGRPKLLDTMDRTEEGLRVWRINV